MCGAPVVMICCCRKLGREELEAVPFDPVSLLGGGSTPEKCDSKSGRRSVFQITHLLGLTETFWVHRQLCRASARLGQLLPLEQRA